MAFGFRLRFTVAESVGLDIDQERWPLPLPISVPSLVLSGSGQAISRSTILVLRGDGFPTEEEAAEGGRLFRDALARALARIRLGADFGVRAPGGGFTELGLADLSARLGTRVLNDFHGLMTFELDPAPRFVRMDAKLRVGRSGSKMLEAFRAAVTYAPPMTERERVAFDLFSASFFMPRPDSRLLMLVSALEVLLDPKPRSPTAVEFVDSLVAQARQAKALTETERDSLVGSLHWLRTESISQAGQALADSLGERQYKGLNPKAFFRLCYDIRSRLVHGAIPVPTREEVDGVAPHLEGFVGDLLAGPVLGLVEL